jgi:hypothetical protein
MRRGSLTRHQNYEWRASGSDLRYTWNIRNILVRIIFKHRTTKDLSKLGALEFDLQRE